MFDIVHSNEGQFRTDVFNIRENVEDLKIRVNEVDKDMSEFRQSNRAGIQSDKQSKKKIEVKYS